MKSGSGIANSTKAAEIRDVGPERDRSRFVEWMKGILPVSRQARAVAAVLPTAMWFRFAVSVARWQGSMVRLLRGDGVPADILIRDHWLRELDLLGAFPIPWRVHGQETLELYAGAGPVVYVGMHLAMSDMALRVLAELGYPESYAISGEGERYPVIGMRRSTPAILTTPFVLMRMRRALLDGHSISCMIDRDHLSESYCANPLRLGARMRVPVIFTWSEVAPDGVVDVFFRPAVRQYSEKDEAVAENLRFFQELRDGILSRNRNVLKPREMPGVPRTAPQAEPDSRIA